MCKMRVGKGFSYFDIFSAGEFHKNCRQICFAFSANKLAELRGWFPSSCCLFTNSPITKDGGEDLEQAENMLIFCSPLAICTLRAGGVGPCSRDLQEESTAPPIRRLGGCSRPRGPAALGLEGADGGALFLPRLLFLSTRDE